jgi:hypothetical protein
MLQETNATLCWAAYACNSPDPKCDPVCLEFAEGGHPSESDSVIDKPKQLLVRIALYFLTGEICGAWVHPSSRWRLGAAVDPMTYAAIQTVMGSSSFNAGVCVYWSRRNSLGGSLGE